MPRGDHGYLDLSRIAQDLQIRRVQVEAVVQLLDDGNTIPFITRYRKERTGGLDEGVLRIIQDRIGQLRQLADRKQTILKTIEAQGKLTDELRAAIVAADNPKRLEDQYLPYKPKKRTLATTAREKGLEPVALSIWNSDPVVANLAEVLPTLVNPDKELNTPDDALLGAQHILAEMIAESADVRAVVRMVLWESGKLSTARSEKLAEGQGLDYKDYFQFTEPVRHIPPHRILAINRGEKESALVVKMDWDAPAGLQCALDNLPLPLPVAATGAVRSVEAGEAAAEAPSAAGREAPAADSRGSPDSAPPDNGASAQVGPVPSRGQGHGHHGRMAAARELAARRAAALKAHPHADFLRKAAEDALTRLLVPSLEREIRRELTHRAEEHAVDVFARNLRSKLLSPPLRGKRVLAIDPGFRTGCKLAALDQAGNLLEDGVIFPHAPHGRKDEAKTRIEELVRKHQLTVIAIGNGTACRETEEVVSDVIGMLEARRTGTPVAPAVDAPAANVAPVEPAALAASTECTVPLTPVHVPSDVSTGAAAPSPSAAPEGESAHGGPTSSTPTTGDSALSTQPSPLSTPSAEIASEIPPVGTPAPEPTASASAEPPAVPAPEAPGAVLPEPNAILTSQASPAPAEAEPAPPAPPLPDAPTELAYVIVNEAGASVYSASPVGREEFPNFDATLRGTISIGRRLQDPLAELVKIDPQHVGVGLYQHDVNPKQLRESLDGVIESCVNTVGVDLNTASVPLLRHVSGMNQLVARDLVEFRKSNGPFQSRDQLLKVPGIGEVRYTQAAGFLKINEGTNPFDRTWIHPESYAVARQILADLGFENDALLDRQKLDDLRGKLKTVVPEEVAARLHVGLPTVRDILDALARPGRDPRDDLPPPVFKKGILKLEDLQAGMELKGTVLNVVDFGAFIDIGLKDSGLVHISQMANRYVKSPYEVAAVGDVVNVWVLAVDQERHRVSLTMIKPGTERKPQERRPAQRGGERGDRGQREQRPPRREQGPRPAVPPREGAPPVSARPRGGPPRQGGGPQRQGGGPNRGGPPQRGGRPLPPRGQTRAGGHVRPGQGRPAQQGGAEAAPPAGEAAAAPAQPAARKPKRSPPKPNLSQSALAGATPLGTFAELAAFWEAKVRPPEEAAPVDPEPEPAAAEPAAEPAPVPLPTPDQPPAAPPPA
jgi:uncharacterized protein